ncbi:MAG: hypothetical protein V2I54_13320 [Bacteroidales bacterium]|jgi:hypothetical protein|nr:hypothetical protein [Bacteroidales bacterium]
MIIKNKLDHSFGPAGTSAGIVLFVAGTGITLFYSPFGIILLVIGAFVGFSHSCTWVDLTRRRVKFSNHLFGFVPTGKWLPLEDGMKLGIKRSNRSWRAYSRSNRALDTTENDYRMMLFDKNGKEIVPIKKYPTLKAAKADLEELSNELELKTM